MPSSVPSSPTSSTNSFWLDCDQAAEDAEAQFKTGQRYLEGGTPLGKDPAMGLDYLQRSARQHYLPAIIELAYIFNSRIMRTDDGNAARAFQYFKEAADQGDVSCQYETGRCYYHSIGTKRNSDSAIEYYEKSAAGGNAAAQTELGKCYIQLDRRKEAFSNFRTAANQPIDPNNPAHRRLIPQAQYNTGICYRDGIGTKKDADEAEKYLAMAASNGYEPAKTALSRMNPSKCLIFP